MIVIAGHSPLGNKSQLTFYRDLLVTIRDKVATLDADLSIKLSLRSRPLPTMPIWGGGLMSPRMFTGLVFEGA